MLQNMSDQQPPHSRGTYILMLPLSAPAALTIGRLGTFPFAVGWYAYVGSAFGAGGLSGRLKHHLAQEKRLHWHIDYLEQVAPIEEIWYLASETPYEHVWASVLTTFPNMTIPISRFGASDCKCPSHLFYCPTPPSFTHFHALTLSHGDVQCCKVIAKNGVAGL